MQKISFYLLPNRIMVTTDVAGFNTELRQVYQRKIKIYKGIDNTIEFEVRNSDNRKDSVVGYEVVAKFFDNERKNVFTLTGAAIAGKPGLMSVTVGKDIIEMLDPQLLTMAAFLRNGAEERLLYSDADFNLAVTVEVFNGYNEPAEFIEELIVFNWEYDRKLYVSEIGNFGTKINDDYSTAPARGMSVSMEGDYQGVIQTYATNDKSTDNMGRWVRLEDWNPVTEPDKIYEGNYRFVRFMHGGAGPGYGGTFNVTAQGGMYTAVYVTQRGQNYRVGDTILIKGSQVGGDDGVNDLTIVINAINQYPTGSINAEAITWSGVASAENTYRSVRPDSTNSASSVDKIIIRN